MEIVVITYTLNAIMALPGFRGMKNLYEVLEPDDCEDVVASCAEGLGSCASLFTQYALDEIKNEYADQYKAMETVVHSVYSTVV